jgi:2-polyprenyl-6-methoxyphenol hydroxylase-like FAD-dependent oxidoreductase
VNCLRRTPERWASLIDDDRRRKKHATTSRGRLGRRRIRHTDIAIAGGGLAGSTAAAMLGRAGVRVVLVDPHPVYPTDFRCEKIDERQLLLLQATGMAEPVLRAATLDGQVWVARFGHVVEKRPSVQYNIRYDTLVNAIRAQIASGLEFIQAKVENIATSSDRQHITLSNGDEVSARLVVVANGLSDGLCRMLGVKRDHVSPRHSISIGFDLEPVGHRTFDFRSLTYFPERATAGMAYLTLFPIGSTLRANLFVYRDMKDPWLRRLREAPEEALFALMPGLKRITGEAKVTGAVRIRSVDLYVTEGYRQPGVVLIGDAFATSCPAAGTGANKVFTDVERLCNIYIPRWLATEGMGREKIADFYDDPVKQECDSQSMAKAFYLRTLSTDAGLRWSAWRWTRFIGQLGRGALRSVGMRLATGVSALP